MLLFTVLTWAVALLTIQAPVVSAVCCDCPAFSSHCADGADCTPCCGVKSCDIFCCSCDNGCRGGDNVALNDNKPHQNYLLESNDCKTKMASADLNGDGHISFLEWILHKDPAQKMKFDVMAEHWLRYDVEGKGYLTLNEAYHRRG